MKIIDETLLTQVADGAKKSPRPTKDIYLAGGCFWGTEHYFKQIEGVAETSVGFANGHTANPTYKEVYTDTTGYAETVHVKYNPDVVSLEFLLQMFYSAEEYHQDYLDKNPTGYCHLPESLFEFARQAKEKK